MALPASASTRRWLVIGVAVIAAVLLVGAALAVAVATDRSAFCSSCHEMQPYHEAWAAGPHSNVACVDCHVERGIVAHLRHKIVALAEVKTHLTGDPTFPLASSPEVPDDRCTACHEDIRADRPGFSHADHASEGPCQTCHSGAGHSVSATALAQAGVLNKSALHRREIARTASVGAGAANLTGHVTTGCDSCHDMKATPCRSCHTAKHETRTQDCGTCHVPGPAFVFSHPSSPDCTQCHTRPAEHSSAACGQCHPKTGVSWAFDHQTAGKGADCATCHTAPAEHSAGACSTCHTSGAKWSFTHPTSTQCAQCHAAAKTHYGTDCASCHRQAGSSWVFSHPSSRKCTACHKAPAKHSTLACTTCHKAGSTWAFRHPTSTSCASCHKAPANHYGRSCASCHSISVPWSSATFRHPAISGGEHSYRSFACTNCHPSGYSSATCTKCHDSASGPRESD